MYKELFFELMQATGLALLIVFICFTLSERSPSQFDDVMGFCLVFGGAAMMLSKRFLLKFMAELKTS